MFYGNLGKWEKPGKKTFSHFLRKFGEKGDFFSLFTENRGNIGLFPIFYGNSGKALKKLFLMFCAFFGETGDFFSLFTEKQGRALTFSHFLRKFGEAYPR